MESRRRGAIRTYGMSEDTFWQAVWRSIRTAFAEESGQGDELIPDQEGDTPSILIRRSMLSSAAGCA